MSRNGAGVYSLPAGSIVTDGVDDILATQHNTPLQDIAADLNDARPIVAGGTGATTATDARANLGLGTFAIRNSVSSANVALAGAAAGSFTGLPIQIQIIRMMIFGASPVSNVSFLVQLGTSGGWVTTGYEGGSAGNGIGNGSTFGFMVFNNSSANSLSGVIELHRTTPGSNIWMSSHGVGISTTGAVSGGGYHSNLGGELDRVRIIPVSGNFSGGNVRITYETSA